MTSMLLCNNFSISVVVTNHNYNIFLPEALSSIKKQLLQPIEVIVVDDASSQSCEEIVKSMGYIYIKTNYKNPLMARKKGFESIKANHICFLDADDKLHPKYLSSAMMALTDNDIDIAYSDVQKFGQESNLTKFKTNIKPEKLWQTNFLHVGCVVSKEAIILSQAFECPNTLDYHEDWMFWRNIIKTGFKYKKHNIPYQSRIHDKNRSKSINAGTYFKARAIKHASFEWCWHNITDETNKLILYNKFSRQTTSDYIGFGYTKEQIPDPDDNKIWLALAEHMSSDIEIVYNKQSEKILFIGPILRNLILRKQDPQEWPMKVIII